MLQMPQFTDQTAILAHLNCRSELHGDATVPAVDLKITLDVGNEVLDNFDPDLRAALYRRPNGNDAAELFDKTKDEAPMRILRFPKLKPLQWDADYPGCTLKIAYGISGANDLLFVADVDGFKFDLKEGGTTAVSFRAIVKPDGEMNVLVSLLQAEIKLTLSPPEPAQQTIEGAKAPPAKTRGKAIDGTK